MSPRMSKPSKVNVVSVLLVLLALSAVYAAIQFGPVYYRKWKVKGELSVSANQIYPRRGLSGGAGADAKDQIVQDTVARLRGVGIEDPGLRITVETSEAEVTVRAEYWERVVHPLVKRTTTLYFRPQYSLQASDL